MKETQVLKNSRELPAARIGATASDTTVRERLRSTLIVPAAVAVMAWWIIRGISAAVRERPVSALIQLAGGVVIAAGLIIGVVTGNIPMWSTLPPT